MKKIVVFLLLGFASFALIAGNSSYAADELVDLYPYDQQACLEAANECTYTKVGSSHWTMEYAGHRYHFIRGVDRILSQVSDGDSDGFLAASDFGALTYNAFAVLTINDTDQTAIVKTLNARTDITSVVHRMYSYFDENGALQMFEDHIGTYYIHNDGTLAEPDWRLADETETAAFDAADDPLVDTPNTRLTHIRIALDDTDADGYVLEPLKYLTWTNADVDTATAPVEDWSTIINGDGVLFDGNPNYVVIPAGWTVVSWGTNDRGSLNTKTADYIHDMPDFLLDDTLEAMTFDYAPQPATFAGITALDDDAVTPGTNIVVEYNAVFDLPTTVSASWINMFDTEGDIIKSTDKLDYSVVISRDDVDLETIDFTYDLVTDSYTASAAVTSVDSSEFGAGYKATWSTTTPEGDETMVSADIVIGVMPPRFANVEDRFINQSSPVDLLMGITADDGYGNDKTSDIEVTYPETLNVYNPYPGNYEIDLEFTHHIFIEGFSAVINLAGTEFEFAGTTNEQISTLQTYIVVYTDVTNFKTSTFSWGSAGVFIEVDGDGNVIRTINRRTWDLVDENGINDPANASGMFDDWLANLTLEEGGFLISVGASMGDAYTAARALAFGDPISYNLDSREDFNYDIITEASYILTVDDMTAPIAMVVNPKYQIYAGDFANVNDAILANVVAYDFTDDQEDLVLYVSNNGGLNINEAGTYTVEVTVEDAAGHTDVATFTVTVLAAKTTESDVDQKIQDAIANDIISEQDVQDLIDGNTKTEAEIQEMIDSQTLTDAEIQALIDAAIEDLPEDETGTSLLATIIISLVAAGLAFGGAFVLFGKK